MLSVAHNKDLNPALVGIVKPHLFFDGRGFPLSPWIAWMDSSVAGIVACKGMTPRDAYDNLVIYLKGSLKK